MNHMKMPRHGRLTTMLRVAAVCAAVFTDGVAVADLPYVPVQWTKFVKVEGDNEPVPEQ